MIDPRWDAIVRALMAEQQQQPPEMPGGVMAGPQQMAQAPAMPQQQQSSDPMGGFMAGAKDWYAAGPGRLFTGGPVDPMAYRKEFLRRQSGF
jgi:hypothetical protein